MTKNLYKSLNNNNNNNKSLCDDTSSLNNVVIKNSSYYDHDNTSNNSNDTNKQNNSNNNNYLTLKNGTSNGIGRGNSYKNAYINGFSLDENSRANSFFLPNEPIHLEITRLEEEQTNVLWLSNVYVIEIRHADYNWIIKKKYKHFLKLYEEFALFKTKYNLIHHSESTGKQTNSKFKSKDHFQLFFQSIANDFSKAKYILEKFLNDVVEHPIFRYHNETLKFFEVSHLSFIKDFGDKSKEGIVQKRSGGHKVNIGCCSTFSCSCCWAKRWLIVRDSWVAYLNRQTGEIRAVLLVDINFSVLCGLEETGNKKGLLIENLSRSLYIQCENETRASEWRHAIIDMLNNKDGKYFLEAQRYGSFAPVRENAMVNWFVDGADYMEAVADAIENATEEIFITDFFLSPEIYLKRPVITGDTYRLDRMLKRKADEGVKVYILLYKELEMAITLNSAYSKRTLMLSSKNVKVLRHPDHMKEQFNSSKWAHHEKVVIVDQSVALFGGIDLCYGRWDNYLHRLTDLGSVLPTAQSRQQLNKVATVSEIIISTDVHSTKLCSHIENTTQTSIVMQEASTNETPVNQNTNDSALSIETKTDGSTNDLENKKDELRKASQILNVERLKLERMISIPEEIIARKTVDFDFSNKTFEFESENKGEKRRLFKPKRSKSLEIHENSRVRFQDDNDSLYKGRFNKIKNIKETINNKMNLFKGEYRELPFNKKMRQIKANIKYRLKSMDSDTNSDLERSFDMYNESFEPSDVENYLTSIGVQGSSKLWFGKDYCNFIFKDFNDLETPFQDLVDRNTMPRIPWHDVAGCVCGPAARDMARHFIQRWNYIKMKKARNNISFPLLLPKSYSEFKIPKVISVHCTNCRVQCLRSVSNWSAGSSFTERSILHAMKHLIETSEHYIYIENQFFVTLMDDPIVINGIANCLYERILRAAKENKQFKVYLVMPLMPGYEGKYGHSSGTVLHMITHYNNASINGLLKKLSDASVDPLNYISFFSMRSWTELNSKIVTELIYVHSKLMIVDDRRCIIGSANINDRSLAGDRDSEVAVLVEDTELVNSHLNREVVQVGKFCSSLRMRLFKEILGQISTSSTNVLQHQHQHSHHQQQHTQHQQQQHAHHMTHGPYSNIQNQTPIDLTDICTDDFQKNVLIKYAAQNTKIYENVFNCIPTNNIKTFLQLKEYKRAIPMNITDPVEARQKLTKITGYIVLYPYLFLKSEDLTPGKLAKESFLPDLFT